MSLYNIMNGINPAAFFIYPVLFENHPDDFPRFRDCFYNSESRTIEVYSRMGNGNRECWEDYKDDCTCLACKCNIIEKNENFISRVDDTFDSTYCTFSFKIPEKYERDVELLLTGKIKDTSKEYKNLLINIFPKIKDELINLLGEIS